ncbi:MAG: TlpA family protein disulfide reductase [Chitinophagaceae bacterium]|nr:MAG: TlpA family protein disulfide reductase [Chitinophagaceae bacterium]
MSKKWIGRGFNIIFFGVLLLLVFSPSAKGWLLRQFVNIGLFNADADKKDVILNTVVDLGISDASGNLFRTSSLKGKTIFINIWASWCPPCRAEMKSLDELSRSFKDNKDVVFIFLNEDDDKQKASGYLKDSDLDIALHSFSESAPSNIYSGTLPTTIVIDKKGELAYRHDGLANYNTESFRKFLAGL